MKLTFKPLKSKPQNVKCLRCGMNIGFVRINNGVFYYADTISYETTEFEKDINVFCWSCGNGQKLTAKK